VQASIPGFESLATVLMKKTMRDKGVASIEELRSLSQEAGVKMIACQMTVDVFGMDPSEFLPGVEFGGASMFLGFAGDTDICLYM
jgi:peroxiredoxin family protein